MSDEVVTIDTTLNSFQVPALSEYTPEFGTKKTSGGLSTAEVNANIMMPFIRQRPFNITANSKTTIIETDCVFDFNSSLSTDVNLELYAGAYYGVEVTVLNRTTRYHTLTIANGIMIPKETFVVYKDVTLRWKGYWDVVCPHPRGDVYWQLGGQQFPQFLFPCTTWKNISENYENEFLRVCGNLAATDSQAWDGGNPTSVYTKEEQAEALPNIKGEMHASSRAVDYGSGVFLKGSSALGDNATGSGNSGIYKWSFNANSSNSIYQDNAHVTPLNSAIQVWKRTN